MAEEPAVNDDATLESATQPQPEPTEEVALPVEEVATEEIATPEHVVEPEPAPAPEAAPAPTPNEEFAAVAIAPTTDIVPEHFEQTFDLEEYARFRRLNPAQVGLLAYVAKSYPRTIGEWDAIKKANLGG